jgi:hypothetical protein
MTELIILFSNASVFRDPTMRTDEKLKYVIFVVVIVSTTLAVMVIYALHDILQPIIDQCKLSFSKQPYSGGVVVSVNSTIAIE